MLQNRVKYILLIVLMLVIQSCIKDYVPEVDDEVGKYVISGKVTNNAGYHYVEVSKSSSLESFEQITVSGCQGKMIDNQGNEFVLQEEESGKYRTFISDQYLAEGKAFKIFIELPDGTEVESEFDTILSGPEIGEVKYEIDSVEITTGGYKIPGIRFFIDLNANENHPKYYKYDLVETWEYRVLFPIEWMYDGVLHHTWPPDSTKMVCWKTENVKEIFVLSTENLNTNTYNDFPLHFVSNQTERLEHKYSLLIKQQAITRKTHFYWQQMYENNNNEGGLYNSQPFIIEGNLKNLSNPDDKIIGYFYAANESVKRIFVSSSIPMNNLGCSTRFLRFGLLDIGIQEYPAYLMSNNNGGYANVVLGLRCVNCLQQGGTNIKPSFWP